MRGMVVSFFSDEATVTQLQKNHKNVDISVIEADLRNIGCKVSVKHKSDVNVLTILTGMRTY